MTPSMQARDVAVWVIQLAHSGQCPYALFVGRSLEVVPADGKRFAKLRRDPQRMALCAGVFTAKSAVEEVTQAIIAAGGVCS